MATNGLPVIPAERMKLVYNYVKERGSAQIKELAQIYNVSEATIRRDLDDLERQGLLERTHGGAILLSYGTSFERAYIEKAQLQLAEKRKIGERAAKFVKDGDTVFLDSGTTSYQLALNLAGKKNITVITYDLFIATNIEFDESCTLIVTGGIKRGKYNVLVGNVVENFIRNLKVDKVFLTADAVDLDFGVSNANFMEAGIKSSLVRAGHIVYLVADSTKFGKSALVKVCEISDLDVIITNEDLPRDIHDKLGGLPLNLTLV